MQKLGIPGVPTARVAVTLPLPESEAAAASPLVLVPLAFWLVAGATGSALTFASCFWVEQAANASRAIKSREPGNGCVFKVRRC